MSEPSEEQQKEFEAIPTERVFCQMKLYLDDEGDITGVFAYHGNRLKALRVSELKGQTCSQVTNAIHRYTQQAIYGANEVIEVGQMLKDLLTGKEDNDQGEHSTEGSRPDETAAGVSYGGEGGIELDNSRSVSGNS